MPTFTGLFQFQGSMGGVTADRNGIVKQTPKSRQITSDRTKENNSEFAIASRQARTVRSTLSPLQVSTSRLQSRLVKQVRKGIALDNTNERGKRILSKREASIVLPGFQISEVGTVESVANIVATIVNGQLQVQKVGGGNPTILDFNLPDGATDVQIASVVAKANINPDVLQVLNIQTTLSTENATGEIILPPTAVTADQNPDVLTIAAIAIRFFQEVNGSLYPLSNRAFDAGKIITAI